MCPNVCQCSLIEEKKSRCHQTRVNSLITKLANVCHIKMKCFHPSMCFFFCVRVHLPMALNRSSLKPVLAYCYRLRQKNYDDHFQSYSIMMFLSVTFPCTLQKGKVEDCSV